MSIALEHVNYIYSPGTAYEKRALNDISLEIGQGQFVGIIGHTGSGKSTLIPGIFCTMDKAFMRKGTT